MPEIKLEDFCRDSFCMQYININHLQSIDYLSEEMKDQAKDAKKQCESCSAKKFYNWLSAKKLVNL